MDGWIVLSLHFCCFKLLVFFSKEFLFFQGQEEIFTFNIFTIFEEVEQSNNIIKLFFLQSEMY